MSKKPWKFDGVDVARSDAEACGEMAPSGHICTRMPDHDGPHIAHVFSEKTGRPIDPVEEWSAEVVA